ncbi:MAG TPA: cation:proton antiporter, partial [Saprospiraceae bacterium]|nr:cation:proton antiporter [Saprospiraceae bacterium]
ESRIQSKYVWETLQFLLNGIVFILIGMQLPEVEAGLERSSLGQALWYGIVISALIIAIRIIWVFPAAYLPRRFSSRIRAREERPAPRAVFLIGWSGMRGLVSIASALAIPLTLPGGEAFPNRHMILFITFVVIVVTLVLQGLSLPYVIRRLKIEVQDNHSLQEQQVRLRLANAVVAFLETEFREQTAENEVFARVKERYERMIEHTARKLAEDDPELSAPAFLADYRKMLLSVVRVRREEILRMRSEKAFPEELLREKEHELDLEEARLHR